MQLTGYNARQAQFSSQSLADLLDLAANELALLTANGAMPHDRALVAELRHRAGDLRWGEGAAYGDGQA